MALMSAVFGIFTQFIYDHMTSITNLTSNITKAPKRSQKKKIYITP